MTFLGNRKNMFTNFDEYNTINGNYFLPKLDWIQFLKMYNTFVSKIKDSYKKDTGEGVTYQTGTSSVADILKKTKFVFERYFNPEETMNLIYNTEGDQMDKKWEYIMTLVIQHGYVLKPCDVDETKFQSKATFFKVEDFLESRAQTDVDYLNPLHIILATYILMFFKMTQVLGTGTGPEKSFKLGVPRIVHGRKLSRKNDVNKYYILSIFSVITNYINHVVNQGKGIITTLEHLKYFFLFNSTGQEQLKAYNTRQTDNNAKLGAIKLKTGSQQFTRTTGKQGQEMSEKVEVGMCKQYGTLKLLTEYQTGNTSIEFGDDGLYRDGKQAQDVDDFIGLFSPEGSTFVMLVAILRGVLNQSNDGLNTNEDVLLKYCRATKASLEFAMSVTSIPVPCSGGSETPLGQIEDQTLLGKIEKKCPKTISSQPSQGGSHNRRVTRKRVHHNKYRRTQRNKRRYRSRKIRRSQVHKRNAIRTRKKKNLKGVAVVVEQVLGDIRSEYLIVKILKYKIKFFKVEFHFYKPNYKHSGLISVL